MDRREILQFTNDHTPRERDYYFEKHEDVFSKVNNIIDRKKAEIIQIKDEIKLKDEKSTRKNPKKKSKKVSTKSKRTAMAKV